MRIRVLSHATRRCRTSVASRAGYEECLAVAHRPEEALAEARRTRSTARAQRSVRRLRPPAKGAA